MRLALVLPEVLALVLMGSACSDGVTQVRVLVDAQPASRASARALRVEVKGPDDTPTLDQTVDLGPGVEAQFPFTVPVVPLGGDDTRTFDVTAWLTDDAHNVRQEASREVFFQKGKTRTVTILFTDEPDADAGTSMVDAGTSMVDAGPPSSCFNELRDGDEVQTDCGGSCPTACSELFDCHTQTDVPASECWALVALYESTGGDSWGTQTGWLASAPCSWFGVACNTGHVVTINLGSNQLTGAIPPELGNLGNLDRLVLYMNGLTGSIPPELGNPTNLTRLTLGTNLLTGSIPPELGNLTNLTGLYLSSNQLTGSIPTELGNLANLLELYLDDNRLTESIPGRLGGLASAIDFDLSNNGLSGVVPASIILVPGTRRFRLRGNGCLTASEPSVITWLANKDPLWNDGC